MALPDPGLTVLLNPGPLDPNGFPRGTSYIPQTSNGFDWSRHSRDGSMIGSSQISQTPNGFDWPRHFGIGSATTPRSADGPVPPGPRAFRNHRNSPLFPGPRWVRLVTDTRRRRSSVSAGIGALNSVGFVPSPDGFRFGKTPSHVVGLDRVRLAGRRDRILEPAGAAGLTRSATIVITRWQVLWVVGVAFVGGRPGDVAGSPFTIIERPRRRDLWAGRGGVSHGPVGGAIPGSRSDGGQARRPIRLAHDPGRVRTPASERSAPALRLLNGPSTADRGGQSGPTNQPDRASFMALSAAARSRNR